MRTTLAAGLLLLGVLTATPTLAAPPPAVDNSTEQGLWRDVTVGQATTVKVSVRGQKLSLPGYSTSLGDEYLVRADSAELAAVARAFGATLEWDDDAERLRCTYKGVRRSLALGQNKVEGPSSLPGQAEAELPVAAQRVDDDPCVPLSVLEPFLDTRVTVRPGAQAWVDPLIRSVRFEGSARKPRLVIDSTMPVTCKAFTLKQPDRYVIDITGAVLDTPNMSVQHPDLGAVRLGQFQLAPAISRIVVPITPRVKVKPEGLGGSRTTFAWMMDVPPGAVTQAVPAPVHLSTVRLDETDKGHRLTLTGDGALHYEWQRLPAPDTRWLLDISNAKLSDPRQEYQLSGGRFDGNVRLSQNQPEPRPVVRVVVEASAALQTTVASADAEKTLTIDILDQEVDPVEATRGRGGAPEAVVAAPANPGGGLIVLDPGHGGSDPGAMNRQLGITEASVTLDICKRLQSVLRSQGWNVLMTRTTDVDLTYAGSPNSAELGARCKVANDARADLFISIHCNASASSKPSGTSVHYYKQGDYVLANALLGPLLNGTGRPSRGLQADRLYVLSHSNMPSVLIETAFITNPTEGGLLNDPSYRQKIAEGLAQGLRTYASRQLNWGTASK